MTREQPILPRDCELLKAQMPFSLHSHNSVTGEKPSSRDFPGTNLTAHSHNTQLTASSDTIVRISTQQAAQARRCKFLSLSHFLKYLGLSPSLVSEVIVTAVLVTGTFVVSWELMNKH